MSRLTWTRNETGTEVLSRDGRLLCSPKDPLREAQSWISHYEDLIRCTDTIAVVGIGAGYHIRALEQMYTDKAIIAFDIDSNYRFTDKKFISPCVLGIDVDEMKRQHPSFFNKWPVVLPFRPAFQPMEKQYVQFWTQLAGRDQAAANHLVHAQGYASIEEAKVWMALRELVK